MHSKDLLALRSTLRRREVDFKLHQQETLMWQRFIHKATVIAATALTVCIVQARDFRAAIVQPVDYPSSLAMKNMGEQISKATNGKYNVKVFGSSTLGSAKDAIEQVKIGAIDMTWISGSDMNQMLPETVIPNLPFIFRDIEHFRKVMYGPVGEELLASFEKVGFVALASYEAGSRSFYAKKPIRTPADLKGLKVRVQPSDMWLTMIQSMGGSPMPLPYAELYTGLKTGLVDSAENNYPSYETAKHYEAAPVFSETQHVMVPEMLIFSKKVWDTLSKPEQDAIRKAAKDSVTFYVKLWTAKMDDAKKSLKGLGVTIVERDQIDHKAFAASQRAVWDKYASTPELKALLEKIVNTK
jgi:tripartite ATP-independent transporter DctP family solute receptor